MPQQQQTPLEKLGASQYDIPAQYLEMWSLSKSSLPVESKPTPLPRPTKFLLSPPSTGSPLQATAPTFGILKPVATSKVLRALQAHIPTHYLGAWSLDRSTLPVVLESTTLPRPTQTLPPLSSVGSPPQAIPPTFGILQSGAPPKKPATAKGQSAKLKRKLPKNSASAGSGIASTSHQDHGDATSHSLPYTYQYLEAAGSILRSRDLVVPTSCALRPQIFAADDTLRGFRPSLAAILGFLIPHEWLDVPFEGPYIPASSISVACSTSQPQTPAEETFEHSLELQRSCTDLPDRVHLRYRPAPYSEYERREYHPSP